MYKVEVRTANPELVNTYRAVNYIKADGVVNFYDPCNGVYRFIPVEDVVRIQKVTARK